MCGLGAVIVCGRVWENVCALLLKVVFAVSGVAVQAQPPVRSLWKCFETLVGVRNPYGSAAKAHLGSDCAGAEEFRSVERWRG